MEVQERIRLFVELIESSYKGQLISRIKKDERFLVVDFKKVISFNPTLAEDVLDDTQETLKAGSIAIETFDTLGDVKNFKVRFENLSKSTYRDIWKIRSKEIDSLITIKGYLRRVGDVQHKVSCGKFECASCGNIMNVLQLGDVWRKPEKCGCGGKKLRLISRELKDIQKIVVEEDPLTNKPTQKPRSMIVTLEDDLTREAIDETLQPSKKISVSGILKDKQFKPNSTEYRKYLEAHSLNAVNDSIENVKITKEDIVKFKEMSQSETLFEDLAQSVVPNIDGHMTARTAIVLQLIGGIPLYLDGVLEERGQIHILLVGSPGSGKSVMLKRSILFLPGSRFTGGKGATGVGLVASVTKDEELGGYSLSAGAVAMASGALCAIDEIDKMSKTDIAHMNNAMVDMKVNIDKADIHGMLETNTAILGAANPKDRVFDTHDLIWKQIGLPKDHLDRYDLIFPVIAPKSKELQAKIANLVVGKYIPDSKLAKPKYARDLVMKYIAYAKRFQPAITGSVKDYIVENFLNLIKPADTKEDAAYFSARLLTNIIRLTQAVAKTRLTNDMVEEDAQRAINILIDSLKMQEIITTDNLFDYEKAEAITPKKKRDIAFNIKKIVRDLMPLNGEGLADYDDILKKAIESGIEDVDVLDVILEKLKGNGDLIEVRRNKYKAQ